ncbi:hypothetical protein M406DRAFT_74044 [Cryphonectria parasitica EP155]|uniref:Uncharacterized protein n=1 Tax=Cryphonectria parasitica (strain ATCC 38755 / EP155) TaxID=660469 RepID=A0A9P5CMU0_CRYP1|nr:uncharacterized protein M406DRAFT_74044 [Cryphonectria parasitica EP155]KAF3763431.1 hypothetical protein M406DRAFT_74044 [Cryphonectria parasitica EP155]
MSLKRSREGSEPPKKRQKTSGPDMMPTPESECLDFPEASDRHSPALSLHPEAASSDSGCLFETSRSRDVSFPVDGPLAPLRMSLTVSEDPLGYGSRLNYRGDLYLTLPQGEFQIGHINGWLLRKSAPSQQGRSSPLWVAEWLQGSMSKYKDEDKDMAQALRSLYGKQGQPQKLEVPGPSHEDDIVFIEMIHIDEKNEATGIKFAGNKLLKHAFSLYYACIADWRISEKYRPKAHLVFILEPALPQDDDIAAIWFRGQGKPSGSKAMDVLERQVADTLRMVYSSASIGYRVLVEDALVRCPGGATVHTIMGLQLSVEAMRNHLSRSRAV